MGGREQLREKALRRRLRGNHTNTQEGLMQGLTQYITDAIWADISRVTFVYI